MKKLVLIASTLLATASMAQARDNVHVVGSSTVLPFAVIAAESFGENFEFVTPVVEGGGTGAGIKRFCESNDEESVDIVNASRAMKDEEKADCAAAGVTDITEVKLGYDGIVFASDIGAQPFALTPAMVYLAINENSVIPSWDIVDASLPAQKISMLIPGTKHGTREVFDIKVLIQGCKDTGMYEEILARVGDAKEAEKECASIRTDGFVVEIDGDYTETLSRMKTDPSAVGVFGLSFYENNSDVLHVATMNGIEPSVQTIADGSYPVSRPLFFYVKNSHVATVPGLIDFVNYFVSDGVAGPGGMLEEYGLVPDPELSATQEAVLAIK